MKMAKPLLYKPPPRWQFWAALSGALLIHIGAVIASMKREAPPVDLSNIPTAEVTATLEAQEQPTPPPEDIPLPPPPPEPQVVPEFHEEAATPPPRQAAQKVAAPIKVAPISSARAQAVFAPRPEYPYEARSRKITGSGVCVLTIDTPSGSVTDATMAQSIGSPILDNATVSTFRRWRFKPGMFSKVKVPITYTMTGASY
jgi:periplasmic protein TonB